ncbi:MAG TPA: LacI family DNA-binding transcriptional regulator [Anaerolineaceae bacterium]|nr:LacI family DNA-binding transcriptional regulator [Anaerolineaceae bacterium]
MAKLRRVTSQDVARRAGVSRTTVSLVLNRVEGAQISPETAQRVLDAAKELGYVPDAAAQALASRRSQVIGLVLSRRRQNISSDTFLSSTVMAVMDTLSQTGFRLLIDVVEDFFDHDSYLRLVRSKHVDGIMLSGPRFDDEAIGRLVQDGFPTVLMGRLPGSDLCSVDVDNVASARLAVEHLTALGHTRIACITNAAATFTAALDRLEGYRQALAAAGVPYDESLVRFGDFGPESGYQQMNDLLDAGASFTAAFVASDVVAVGSLAALRKRGLRVPDDVSLVGFDDVAMASFAAPPLTTVHLPITELASRSCLTLLDLIQGLVPAERHVVLDTHLVVRHSTAAPR